MHGAAAEAAEPVFHPDSYGYRPGRSALYHGSKGSSAGWKKDWGAPGYTGLEKGRENVLRRRSSDPR